GPQPRHGAPQRSAVHGDVALDRIWRSDVRIHASPVAHSYRGFWRQKHRRSGDCPLRQCRPRIPISGLRHRKTMSAIRNICVYCGSGPGADPAVLEAARALGTILAKNDTGLVYGGGSIGLMGELANAVLD